ncbi:MAG: NADH-quinone oxidoreductase subunit N [Acidobacteriota bacterium]
MQIEELNLNYSAIAPEIIISVTGIIIMLYGVFKRRAQRELVVLGLAGLAIAGLAVANLWGQGTLTAFSSMIIVDSLSLFFIFTFLIIAGFTLLASMSFIESEQLPAGEYYALVMFATVGMMLMAAGNDLVMIFLGLELSSISTYVLAGYRRSDLRSNESALKYFILGSFSTAFLLYGMALVYGATGSTNLDQISGAIARNINLATQQEIMSEMLYVGAAMMLVGFGFKVATAPFHIWTPDVYEGAPTPVTAFMAAGPKAAGFAAFLRVFVFIFSINYMRELHSTWTSAVQVLAIFTMVVGNVVAISQTDIKRMLAYSSIAHAGYALVGLLSENWGVVGFYMLTYSVMNMGAFAIVASLAGEGDKQTQIESYAGLGFKHLGRCIALLVFMLSLAGVPLTAGFMGKFLVFRAAWEKGFHTLVIIAVLNSAASVYYYLRPMVVMFFREGGETSTAPILTRSAFVTILLALVGTFYLGLLPGRIMDLLEAARQSIAIIR